MRFRWLIVLGCLIVLGVLLGLSLATPQPSKAIEAQVNAAAPPAPGTLLVVKQFRGDALGLQGTVVVRSECNGFTFSPDLISPAGSTVPTRTRVFFGQGAGVSCTVTEIEMGVVPGITVDVAGSPQTVTIPSGGVATVVITDTYTAAVPETTTTPTTTVPPETTTTLPQETTTLPEETTVPPTTAGTTTTTSPATTTTNPEVTTLPGEVIAPPGPTTTTIPEAPVAPITPLQPGEGPPSTVPSSLPPVQCSPTSCPGNA